MYHRISDIAQLYGVSTRTVHAWIKCGDLKSLDVSADTQKRHAYRITDEQLVAFNQLRETGRKPASRNASAHQWF